MQPIAIVPMLTTNGIRIPFVRPPRYDEMPAATDIGNMIAPACVLEKLAPLSSHCENPYSMLYTIVESTHARR